MKRKELRERVAFLQGLARGLRTEQGSRESEILVEVLDVMGSVVQGIDRLRSQQGELSEYLDAVDQDLADLEEDVGAVQIQEKPGGTLVAEAGTTTVEGSTRPTAGRFVATDCPACGQTVYFSEDFLDDDQLEITCPDCGEIVWDTDEDYELSDASPDDHRAVRPGTRHDADHEPDEALRESWPE